MKMGARIGLVALVLLLAAAIPPNAPLAAMRISSLPVLTTGCFTGPNETGYCIGGRFGEYWEQNGGLAVFGYPITDEHWETNTENGVTYWTQWFQRNRFELHTGISRPYDVQLGRLGAARLVQQGRDWNTFPKVSSSTLHYYGTTGHAIDPQFWSYWSSHGLEFDGGAGKSEPESIALFGLPISELNSEQNLELCQLFPTQWFERARFEYHSENAQPYDVELGLLGNEIKGLWHPRICTPRYVLNILRDQAKAQGYERPTFESGRLAIYDDPAAHRIWLLTPAANLPDLAARDLPQRPDITGKLALGGLTIIRDAEEDVLRPDYYIITFIGGEMVLSGTDNQPYRFRAFVRELPVKLPQPLALISAQQICIAWNATMVCGAIKAAPEPAFQERLRNALRGLEVVEGDFDLNAAIPHLQGSAAQYRCAEALGHEPPNYTDCWANLLVAPALKNDPVRLANGRGIRTRIGVLDALTDVEDAIFSDANLTMPVDRLPAGRYLIDEELFNDDRPIARDTYITRIRLSGPAGTFYLPAVGGAGLLGQVVFGPPPSGNDAFSTRSLVVNGRCFFNIQECPGGSF